MICIYCKSRFNLSASWYPICKLHTWNGKSIVLFRSLISAQNEILHSFHHDYDYKMHKYGRSKLSFLLVAII